jgi:hypothetical protein
MKADVWHFTLEVTRGVAAYTVGGDFRYQPATAATAAPIAAPEMKYPRGTAGPRELP